MYYWTWFVDAYEEFVINWLFSYLFGKSII